MRVPDASSYVLSSRRPNVPFPHKRDARINRYFLMWTIIGLVAASIAAAIVAGALMLAMTGQS
jgi:hypothetical protein